MLVLCRVLVQVALSRGSRENPALFRVSRRFTPRFQSFIDIRDHWQHTACRLCLALCHLYKPASAVQIDILPPEGESFARAHPCAANDDRSVTPRLRTVLDISLPVAVRKNRVPLLFTFRQSDLDGPFELSPLERQIKSTAEAPKAA